MTSVAVSGHFYQQTTEVFETILSEPQEDTAHIIDEDQEMAESHKHPQVENGSDDQDMYNAEIESTLVEPPQSDVLMTHAPSTIVDETDYVDEVEYEEADVISKRETLQFPQGSDIFKQQDTTTAQTPPPSTEEHIHPSILSPTSSRLHAHPRPATPLAPIIANLTNLATSNAGGEDPLDDDWPICLYTPAGQEYILFRSDGDAEALFEDHWLKTQPLETFFSSIRQTLENELASLTASFGMDEIVLAIPDLDVSIAEDNFYTRDISLQDLVILINALSTKNGTERPNTCRIHLSLQPRFIARFNQLVSSTSQPWRPKEQEDSEAEEDETEENQEEEVDHDEVGNAGEEDQNPDQQYEQYEEEDPVGEAPEYEEEEEQHAEAAAFQEAEQTGTSLTAAEEDELYEENDDEDEEPFDTRVESAEAHVNEDDDVVEDEVYLDTSDHEPYDEAQEEHEPYDEADDQTEYIAGEEADQVEEQFTGQDYTEEQLHVSDYHDDNATGKDDDDLISYEEAVDQADDGHDYRQQYLAQDDAAAEDQEQNGEINGNHHDADIDIPEHIHTDEARPMSHEEVTEPFDLDKVTPKRSLDEVVDQITQDSTPPPKRTRS